MIVISDQNEPLYNPPYMSFSIVCSCLLKVQRPRRVSYQWLGGWSTTQNCELVVFSSWFRCFSYVQVCGCSWRYVTESVDHLCPYVFSGTCFHNRCAICSGHSLSCNPSKVNYPPTYLTAYLSGNHYILRYWWTYLSESFVVYLFYSFPLACCFPIKRLYSIACHLINIPATQWYNIPISSKISTTYIDYSDKI